jgi:DNA-binding Xre family transcriptional regulator
MRNELDAGFTFFTMRANPWAGIPEGERDSKWHIGAIIGEALSHTSLRLIAEATARAEGVSSTSKATVPNEADHDGAASVRPVTVNGGSGKNPGGLFPNRASWLKDRLHERAWNKNDLSRRGGPDRKTVQKMLDGQKIREDVLEKVATALSKAPTSKKLPNVTLVDIPQD